MNPRERTGQDSIANDAPAGHSAPMPIPSIARKKNRNAKLGEKPAMKLQIEYHRIEIISGIFPPRDLRAILMRSPPTGAAKA